MGAADSSKTRNSPSRNRVMIMLEFMRLYL
jgi:hypothetical protein